jgi:hypothetical protein
MRFISPDRKSNNKPVGYMCWSLLCQLLLNHSRRRPAQPRNFLSPHQYHPNQFINLYASWLAHGGWQFIKMAGMLQISSSRWLGGQFLVTSGYTRNDVRSGSTKCTTFVPQVAVEFKFGQFQFAPVILKNHKHEIFSAISLWTDFCGSILLKK